MDHSIAHSTADVLEINVNPVGRRRREFFREVGRLMIDAGVIAEVSDRELALRGPTGNADYPCSHVTCDLPGDGTDSARSRRNYDGFTSLDLCNIMKADKGRHSGKAERTKPEALGLNPFIQPQQCRTI